MIKVDEANSYTVDFFRVKGGNDHTFSFHAAEGTVNTDGLNLTAQSTGTYAGPDVNKPENGIPTMVRATIRGADISGLTMFKGMKIQRMNSVWTGMSRIPGTFTARVQEQIPMYTLDLPCSDSWMM
jgi:hypothetical protein